FAIQIAEYFEFCPEWYRGQKAAALVWQYYVLLRSVLRTKPLVRRCLVRCRHCRIFFLTHPCNGGRKDLGCPFGCRRAHRKQQSTVRSVAYYRDPIGKKKKQALNGRISDLLKFCWPTFLFHGRKSCMLWPVICQGRTISQEALEWLRGWIGAHRDWSRKRLARELCVLWDWRNGKGRLKDFAARSFLLKLTERELIELPPVREYKRSGPQTVGWVKADFEHTPEPLCAELEQVRPVQLDWVEAGSDPARRVAFYLDRYHYLGWHVVGQNIGYLARDGSGRDLAVLLFGAAAWRCAPRDRHLDWSESERLIGLHRIANNS